MNFIYLSLMLLISVSAKKLPINILNLEDQLVDKDSSVALECVMPDNDVESATWVKKEELNRRIISADRTVVSRDKRYSVEHNKEKNSYVLHIKFFQEKDEGEYQCQVISHSQKSDSKSVNVWIKRPPIIYENSTSSLEVKEGGSATFYCYAGGVPKPNIIWRKEGHDEPLENTINRDGVLKIFNIRKKDSGTYYCTANNTVFQSARKYVNLSVKFPPSVKVVNSVVYQASLNDAELRCRVQSYPPAAITWVFENETITKNKNYNVHQFALSDEETDSILHVLSVKSNQYGYYICRAINAMGVSEDNIQLSAPLLIHPPEITIVLTTANSITIEINPSNADIISTIQGYIISYKSESNNSWNTELIAPPANKYLISGLSCGTKYQINAIAFNNIGKSNRSVTLKVRTKDKKPVFPDAETFLDVGTSSVSLNIKIWKDETCPVNYLIIEYKLKHESKWTIASKKARLTYNYVIMELSPSTRYNLRITPVTNTETYVAEYEFTTLPSPTGSTQNIFYDALDEDEKNIFYDAFDEDEIKFFKSLIPSIKTLNKEQRLNLRSLLSSLFNMLNNN